MKDGHKEKLIKFKNPWAFRGNEWDGKWNDKDECWGQVKDQELVKTKLLKRREQDRIAWLPFETYLDLYDSTAIAPLDNSGPMGLVTEKDRRDRKAEGRRRRKVPQGEMDSFRFDGSWLKGVTFGGEDSSKDEFGKNPQYLIILENWDGSGKEINLIPELSTKAKSSNNNGTKIKYDIFSTIEFKKQAKNGNRYEIDFLQSNKPIGGAEDETTLLTEFTQLKPGSYCFVVSSEKEGDFMLRFLVDAGCGTITELDEDVEEKPGERKTTRNRGKLAEEVFRGEAGDSNLIDVVQLKICLDKAIKKEHPKINFEGLSIETCRCIFNLLDEDRSGQLSSNEFGAVWDQIDEIVDIFQKRDKDKCAKIEAEELKVAFDGCGVKVNREVVKSLVLRYSSVEGDKGTRCLSFEGFTQCLFKMKSAINSWKMEKEADDTSEETCAFTLTKFVETLILS